jgi:hypothetical protein
MPKSAPLYILILCTLILTLKLLCLIRLNPMAFLLLSRFPNNFFFGPFCYKHVHRQDFNIQCICNHHTGKVSLRQWCPQLTTLYYTLVLWRISSPLFFRVNLSENGSRNYSFHTHCQKCTLL